MRFRRGARLDTSQVRDVRGRRMGGGPVAIGGGGLGLAGLVIYLLVSALSGGGSPLGDLSGVQVGPNGAQGGELAHCERPDVDLNAEEDCRLLAVVNTIQAYWTREFERRDQRYQDATTVFFDDSVQTGCGFASSQVGPFYCPRDATIYIDLGFYDELRSRLGAQGGPFAEAYVLAHEYGHHVQNLTGVLDRVRGDERGPESAAVRSELQADCYAGVWASNVLRASPELVEQPPTQRDINDALDTATAIGDDRIQERAQGQVNPETWSHGSSEQRRRWFSRGYRLGDPGECNTFAGSI